MKISQRLFLVIAAVIVMAFVIDTTTFAQFAKKKTTRRKTVTKKVTVAKTPAAPAAPVAPVIAKNTELKIRLSSDIDTSVSKDGDKFTAIVIDPSQYAQSTVEGHIATVQQSGKLKGKTAISLVFDRILFTNNTERELPAQLVKVYDSESAKKVDNEGNIESGDKTKTTTVRAGGGAAAGAVLGGLAGGGKGAVIGAILGGAAGAGSTYIQGVNKIKLDRGTEMLIVTLK
jgi:hypothetical protein